MQTLAPQTEGQVESVVYTQPETRQLPLGFKAEIEEMLIFDNQRNQISESFPKTCCNDFDSIDVRVTYGDNY